MSDNSGSLNTDGEELGFDLKPGLFAFYSSQAELMLAQYENIKRLLGPTTHGTPSGDLCEHLIREVLRKFLPPTVSVDKGYFYGRSTLDGKDTHCPEIDILIHNSHEYAPLYRTGDFVIVQPESVLGMVQVKLALDSGKLDEGLKNIIPAKQHLLDVLWLKKKAENPKVAHPLASPPRVFSGIIAFEGQTGRDLDVYRERMLTWYLKYRRYEKPNAAWTAMYTLPNFVGSLQEFFVYSGTGPYWNEQYFACESEQEIIHDGRAGKPEKVKRNLCIQAFLAIMRAVLGSDLEGVPPFAFPDTSVFRSFTVLAFEGGVQLISGNLILHRNDGWIAEYTRDMGWSEAIEASQGPLDKKVHIVCDAQNILHLCESLRQSFTPEEIIVRRETHRSSEYERYASRKIVSVTSNIHTGNKDWGEGVQYPTGKSGVSAPSPPSPP